MTNILKEERDTWSAEFEEVCRPHLSPTTCLRIIEGNEKRLNKIEAELRELKIHVEALRGLVLKELR